MNRSQHAREILLKKLYTELSTSDLEKIAYACNVEYDELSYFLERSKLYGKSLNSSVYEFIRCKKPDILANPYAQRFTYG